MTADARLRGPTIIEPADLGATAVVSAGGRSMLRWLVLSVLVLVIGVLGVAGWFVLTAQRVEFTFDPAPEQVALIGSPLRFQIGESYLLRPGSYRVEATCTGHHPLAETVEVASGQANTFHFAFRRLPGLVTMRVVGGDDPDTDLPDVQVSIDAEDIGTAPLTDRPVEPGEHVVALHHERYQASEHQIVIEGMEIPQTFTYELRPDWADVTIASEPLGATVRVDGVVAGSTPCEIEMRSGPRTIRISADGYYDWTHELEIVPEQPLAFTDIELVLLPGRIHIVTTPPGAQVLLDGRYVGVAPVETELPQDPDVQVRVTLDGHAPDERTVEVVSQQTTDVAFELVVLRGLVRLDVEPADAALDVDGVPWGTTPAEITLPAVEHELVFSREGFETATRTVRPRPELPGRLIVRLVPIVPPEEIIVREVKASNGYDLVLMPMGRFEMGASRREQGRRSNETLRTVEFTRPFLMGVREVTNDEFRAFQPGHQSGAIQRISLGGGNRPVAQVSWDDAARYCNWLSVQDGLTPAYSEQPGERMVPVNPIPDGYRLPTEAEWSYAARLNGAGPLLKYPWGASFPPPEDAGNFADESAAPILNRRIPNYEDAYAGSAPVGSYTANPQGLFDMGGNVAEWCHDFYTTYTYDAQAVAADPTGPEDGQHHVVRGSSWRHSSISMLRLSYRDYSDEPRDDLGFRICRYVTNPEGSQ